jgi:hypothetical protein
VRASGIAESGNISHPGFFVEVDSEEPACLVRQHRVDTGGKVPLHPRHFALEMATEDIV